MGYAYCQILLENDSRKVMSYQIPTGIYTPNRILNGLVDTGNHFQSVTEDALMISGKQPTSTAGRLLNAHF